MTPPKETRRAEGRGWPGGSLQGEAKVRTQGRGALPPNLMRVNEAARRDKRTRFTALLHHVDVAALERAFRRVKRSAAPGVDGETVASYEGNLQERLTELCDRVHRGSYRPKPVRRVFIPKAGGGQRPIGVPTLEDKVVQGAVAEAQVAMRLGISASAVYYWIDHGQLEARRGPAGRLCVPFSSEVDQACRERMASSSHLPMRTQNALQEVLV